MKLQIVFTILLGISQLHAECLTEQVSISRDLDYSLTVQGVEKKSGSFAFKTVTLPVDINGKKACFHQKGHLDVTTTAIKNQKLTAKLSPLSVKYEKVPESRTLHYVDVDQKKLMIVSFVCMGEIPLSEETLSDSLLNLAKVGAKAKNNNVIDVSNLKLKNATLEHFFNIFSKLTSKSTSDIQHNTNIYVPALLNGMSGHQSTDQDKTLIRSFYNDKGARLNGCSEEFRREMQDHLLEEIIRKKTFKDINFVRKGSKAIEMTWKL